MRVCIHRGTKEIGGTCIELESQGKRIVLDIGLPLDVDEPDDMPLHPIQGFAEADESLLGVVISHPHRDHYGLAYRLPGQTRFLIGKAAQAILAAADVFTPSGVILKNVTHLEDRKAIRLGSFTVTPYLVDHSAYDAYAVLVEADGKRLFYTGDFRAHGRKAALIDRLIGDPPKNVNALLMEGTTIGRADDDTGYLTETELESRFVELFRQARGMSLVWCSGQNIDRLVTAFRACKKTGRQLIVDMYTAHILRATGNPNIPQADWENVRVLLPKGQKRQIIRKEAFDVSNSYKQWRIYPEQLAQSEPKSVMLFRPSMMSDLEEAGCVEDSRLIFSMWRGYWDQEETKPLREWLESRRIPIDHCHTSGHASLADLIRMRGAFPDAPVLPIHTAQPARFQELFGKSRRQRDGVWQEIK